MKFPTSLVALILTGLVLNSCDNGKAEAAEKRKQEQIRLLKQMDAEAKAAREKASTGTVPTPKPFENPLLK